MRGLRIWDHDKGQENKRVSLAESENPCTNQEPASGPQFVWWAKHKFCFSPGNLAAGAMGQHVTKRNHESWPDGLSAAVTKKGRWTPSLTMPRGGGVCHVPPPPPFLHWAKTWSSAVATVTMTQMPVTVTRTHVTVTRIKRAPAGQRACLFVCLGVCVCARAPRDLDHLAGPGADHAKHVRLRPII